MSGVDAGAFAADFVGALTTKRLGRTWEHLAVCASTNDEVATRGSSGAPEGFLVLADEQSSGRGRRGRRWLSEPGKSLTFSLLLRPALAARQVAPLTLLAGAAVATALSDLGLEPKLKWPNDVLLDGADGPRKLAGILTEMSSDGDHVRHVVLGIGINVNAETFAEEIARVTSVQLSLGKPVNPATLLASFLNAFEPRYDAFVAHGPAAGLAEWNRYALLGLGCWLEREGKRIDGVAAGVDASGALLVRTSGEVTISIHGGEVNWPALK